MTRAETIKAICELVIDSGYGGRSSMTDLLKRSGYYGEMPPPDESEFEAHIRRYPSLIEHWYLFSGDQRSYPAWFLEKPGENGGRCWKVARFPDTPATEYPDGIRACAAFVARNVERLDRFIREEAARPPEKARKRGRKKNPRPPSTGDSGPHLTSETYSYRPDPTVVISPFGK